MASKGVRKCQHRQSHKHGTHVRTKCKLSISKKLFSVLLRHGTNSFPLSTGVSMEMEKWEIDRGRRRKWRRSAMKDEPQKKKWHRKLDFSSLAMKWQKLMENRYLCVWTMCAPRHVQIENTHCLRYYIHTADTAWVRAWLHAYCKIPEEPIWMNEWTKKKEKRMNGWTSYESHSCLSY